MTSLICSIHGCKRAVACLCRHCQKDVCSKHFNEHQTDVNNELIPITDRLNELKMTLQMNDQTGPFAILQTWRDKKYEEIDEEYNHKVKELKKKISKYDEQITQVISNIQELINEGDVSIDQVKQIQKTIEILTNQVNNLVKNESIDNLVGTNVSMDGVQYLVKAKIQCNNTDLYAVEREKPLIGYTGLCPQCDKPHVVLKENRGFYVLCKTFHDKIRNQK